MKMKLLPIILGILIAACGAAQAVTSTFDTGNEGWVEIDMADYVYNSILATYNVGFSPTAGNPGGYISGSDPSGYTFWFSAPAKFLGDKSSTFGKTLSYDIKLSSAPYFWPIADVVLRSGSKTLLYMNQQMPTTSWKKRSVLLMPQGGWHKDSLSGATPTNEEFIAILKSLTGLYIRGEYVNGSELNLLDNVVLDDRSVVGASNKAAYSSVVASSASKYIWILWGKVVVLDSDTFTIDDGSGMPIKVLKAGHGLKTGQCALVKGDLDTSVTPRVLSAIEVTPR